MGEPSQLELRILIKTVADNQGIQLEETAINGLANSITKASAKNTELSKSGKESAHELTEVGHSAHGTAQILEGLTRVQEGGAQGFVGLITGMRGFISVAKLVVSGSLPFAAVAAIIASVAAAAYSMKDSLFGAGKEMGTAKTESEALTKALALIKADSAATTAFQLKKIEDQAKLDIDRIHELNAALGKVEENEKERALDKIKNDPNLSPVQREHANFDIESKASAKEFEKNQHAADKEIARLKDEKNKTYDTLRSSVEDEKKLREERAALRETQSNQEGELNEIQPLSPLGFRSPRALLLPKEQEKADEAQERLDATNKRIAILDGEKDKGDGLLNAAHEDILKKNEAAIAVQQKNDPAIEKLELDKKVEASTFATKQNNASDDFVAKQAEEIKKLSSENAALAKEKTDLTDRQSHSLELGGDPAAKARIGEIEQKQAAIALEEGQRTGLIPKVKNGTDSLRSSLTKEFNDISSGSTFPAGKTNSPGSGGTITKDGQSIHVSDEKPGSGGTITKDGQSIHVSDEKSVAAIQEAAAAAQKHDAEVAAAIKEKAMAEAASAAALAAAQKEASAAQLKQSTEAVAQTAAASEKQLAAQTELAKANVEAHTKTVEILAVHAKQLADIKSQLANLQDAQQ